jgi:AbiV family abortive infection protein
MKTKIYNISQNECKNIYSQFAVNGNDLISISKISEQKEKFGIALSLLILGAEEYCKAILILLRANNIKVFVIKELRQAFSDHKKKHEVATLVEAINLIEHIIEPRYCYQKRKKKESISFREIFTTNPIGIYKMFNSIKLIAESIDWWGKADYFKNRGFYVDFDDKLLTPDDFKKNDYEQALLVVSRLKKSYRILNIAFKRMSTKQRNELIIDLNQGIKLYVENTNKVDQNAPPKP